MTNKNNRPYRNLTAQELYDSADQVIGDCRRDLIFAGLITLNALNDLEGSLEVPEFLDKGYLIPIR